MLIFRFKRSSGKFEISGVGGSRENSRGRFRPPVDISHGNDEYLVQVDLPGTNPDNICIEASENRIVISGKTDPPEHQSVYRLIESPSGPFLRILDFEGGIVAEDIDAQLSDGVLKLRVPVKNSVKDSTRIEVRIQGTGESDK